MKTSANDLLLSVAMALMAAGCGSGGEASRPTGSVGMALTTTNGNSTFRLTGTFDIAGPQALTVTPPPNDELFKVELPAGDYTITLREGWSIQQSVNGGLFLSVDALLSGPATQAFTIFSQEITRVRFDFRAGPDVLAFGNGELDLGIGVNQGGDATACTVVPSSCGPSTVTCSGHQATIENSCDFSTGPEGTTLTCNGASTTIPSGFGANPNGYGLTARRLADLQARLLDYFEAHGSFPVATAPFTPFATCCAFGGVTQCPANPAAWDIDPWQTLGFSIDTAHTFVYQYTSAAGNDVRIAANGDLDCDGTTLDYFLDCSTVNGNPSCTLTLPVPCPGVDYE
jgi:hypothetical protein